MNDYAVILCARMGSNRLPGKALVSYLPDGTPNLEQIISRWKSSRRSPTVIVATSTQPGDRPILTLCDKLGVAAYAGELDNVLLRMEGAIAEHAPQAHYIARALADNPLVDIPLSDWRLDTLSESGAEGLWLGGDEGRLTYAATTDVWSRAGWEKLAAMSSGSQLEHPGAAYWDNLHKFETVLAPLPPREYLAPVRTELDTDRDLVMFRELWAAAVHYGQVPILSTLWALDYLTTHPDMAAINADVPLKTQTKAVFGKGSNWKCAKCQQRLGGVVNGDLELHCSRCGRSQKFYAMPPNKRPMLSGRR